MNDDWDIPPDEYYEEMYKRRLHRKLMQLPPGHPDAGDIKDALEEIENEQAD